MVHRHLALVLLSASLVACGAPSQGTPDAGADEVPLDAFVADTTGYHYDVLWEQGASGFQEAVLDVTSQTWRSSDEVDRTDWWHDVAIAWPDGAPTDLAIVVVSGGDNDPADRPAPDDGSLDEIEQVAALVNTPVISVSQIPNEPLTIAGQGGPRDEDDLVAATWDRVLETGDPTWSAYFAMTRAVVRSLDAVQDYMAARGTPIERFVVTGFSKRGATTWLVGAADPRVVAIAPGVFDFLNFRPQARHHLDVYGTPAPAVRPYAEYDLLKRIEDPEADVLLSTSDPYVYRDRLTLPKYVLASPGDQFFLPDAMRYYLTDLPGETLVRYEANTDHSLAQPDGDFMDTVLALTAWYATVRDGVDRPSLQWHLDGDTLSLTVDPAPASVKLWTATNPDARDFRREALGAVWTAENVTAASDGTFSATVPPPASGWTAFYLEAKVGAQTYSTQVYVTPDELP